ncbi:MAG: hypothetical protein K0Q79_415 [Flavipsychrobacter sp.]|jgi:uncharacterized protein (DUF1697 family)|nr:hypothetical protein [Flavipsychrobacter sp.]
MIRYVAFLRGFNASGQVSMEELNEQFGLCGFHNVKTYIQTDNVVFETEDTDEAAIARKIEKQLKDKLGFEVKVIIRMLHEIKNVLKNNPYINMNKQERNLYVTFLSEVPSPLVRGALEVYSNDAEDARLFKREVYIHSNNYGKTCFPNSLIEKKFGVTATTRNWSLLNRILEL